MNSKWPAFKITVDSLLKDPKFKMVELKNHLSLEPRPKFKRERHLEELIKSLANNKNNRIIIFGGISSIIRESKKEFAKWIIANDNAKLFICYENESLVKDREADLACDVYKPKNKSQELHRRKITELYEFKNYFIQELGVNPNKRIQFIELSERLTGYVIINGHELFFTPLLHIRSEETYVLMLENEEILIVVDYMISKLPKDCLLISEFQKIKSELIS